MREIVLSIVESHNEAIELAAAPGIASLSASPSPGNLLSVGSESQKFLCHLILVLLAAGKAKMKVKDLVHFVGDNVESSVNALVVLYADVCGAVPGVSPVVSGSLQAYLSLRVVEMLHELTFWTTHDDLLSRFGIGSHNQKRVSEDTVGTPLGVSAVPYKHHIGQIIAYLIKYDFCSFAITHMSRLARSFSDSVEVSESQLREHLSFFKSLLTLTDEFVGILRKTLAQHGILENVCDPLMQTLSGQQPPIAKHVELLTQLVDVTATLTCRSGAIHQYWDVKKASLMNLVEAVTMRSAEFVAAGGERTFIELVAQLVRLVVNSQCSAPAAAVLRLWNTRLDAAGKQCVAHRLSNPKSRSRPLDITSPVCDVLRPVFRVASDTSAVAAAQRRQTDAATRQQVQQECSVTPHAGGGGGNRSYSPGQRKRGASGQRRRSQSRDRTRPRRCRPSRRQRMKRRFQLLAQRRSQNAELDAATLELLEADDADSDSSSSDNTEEKVEAAVALPDLSRWRRGPPPRSIPLRYICLLSHALIQSTPVLSSAGYVFDEDVILDYLKYYQTCPISGAPLLPGDLVVDTLLKEELNKVRENFV
ncbi:hypothetical protein ABL78_7110 [Leptomonas seymouri]|uniref:U-box domain-containing protein n=1 Tax=Leptomonas seymouri TaxID=5684 RepID=A0A0N1I134_LEPSE|nr:hypothetical protein ABL78_7110 [Leptomonas seymouri]|eukprot:KPI83844.1 hypothetical protein ABL78_7110 [Leptomonas seymouri]